jgi:hypothetical protein
MADKVDVNAQVYVEIVQRVVLHRDAARCVPEHVVRRMGPMSRTKADRVEDGASINLDHERFFIRQVPA